MKTKIGPSLFQEERKAMIRICSTVYDFNGHENDGVLGGSITPIQVYRKITCQ